MTIFRQHETTRIVELEGVTCEAFRAVRPVADANSLSILYLKAQNVWHRFYLDAGLLFWKEGAAPDPDDDLRDNEYYCDMADALKVKDVAIRSIIMADDVCTIEFANEAVLTLRHEVDADATLIERMQSGSANI